MVELMTDIYNWRVTDPAPGVPLPDIRPVSARAWALFARNREHALLHSDVLRLAGAVDMMHGLDYHYNNFMLLMKRLSEGEEGDLSHHLGHEAVAYLNRLGQYYYFADSSAVTGILKSDAKTLLPRVSELVVLRNKFTAHRSIDHPRSEDTQNQQLVLAMGLSWLGGNFFHPKNEASGRLESLDSWGTKPYLKWSSHYLIFRIPTPKGWLDFNMELDHDVIMDECYSLLNKLLA